MVGGGEIGRTANELFWLRDRPASPLSSDGTSRSTSLTNSSTLNVARAVQGPVHPWRHLGPGSVMDPFHHTLAPPTSRPLSRLVSHTVHQIQPRSALARGDVAALQGFLPRRGKPRRRQAQAELCTSESHEKGVGGADPAAPRRVPGHPSRMVAVIPDPETQPRPTGQAAPHNGASSACES